MFNIVAIYLFFKLVAESNGWLVQSRFYYGAFHHEVQPNTPSVVFRLGEHWLRQQYTTIGIVQVLKEQRLYLNYPTKTCMELYQTSTVVQPRPCGAHVLVFFW